MKTLLRTLVMVVPLAAAAAALQAQTNSFMSAQHGDAKATVMILDGQVSLKIDRAAAANRIVDLGKGWKKISLVRFSPDASRLAIVSESDTTLLTVVDAAALSVLATYPVADAAISPDDRAVVFEHVRGGQGAGGTRLALVPLHADNAAASAMAFLPGTDGGVLKQSRFQWMDPEVVAFIGTTGNEARVLAYQLDATGRVRTSGVKPLPGPVAPDALARAQITRLPSAGLTLQVQLPGGSPSEVRIW